MPVRLSGSTSGYTELSAPAVAGSNTLTLPTGNGSANQLLKNGSTAGSLAFSTATEDSSGNFAFNSGYGSAATAYGCRAWVNFNGTGVVAIRASGNVSSITDNGTGDYTVNFTTAMPDANYCVQGCTERNLSTENGSIINQNTQTALTTSAARICSYRVGIGAVDHAQMFVAIFR